MLLEKEKKNLIGIFKKVNDVTKKHSEDNNPFEVTLLSKEELNSESSVIKKIMELRLPDYIGSTGEKNYWLKDSIPFNPWKASEEACGCYVEDDKIKYASTATAKGVRPIIKFSDLDENLNNIKTTIDNDIEAVEFDSQYYSALPVKFYVDRENSMLISKSILFSSPINLDSQNYDGSFETSELYSYLNSWFIKTLIPSSDYEQSQNNDHSDNFTLILTRNHKSK